MLNGQVFSWLQCPSDAFGGNLIPWYSVTLTKTNYLGIFSGLNDRDNDYWTGANMKQASVFHAYNWDTQIGQPATQTRVADITDGTSNTMAVAEYLKGIDSSDFRGAFYTSRAGCQFLYVKLGPNSTAADNLLAWPHLCDPDGSDNHPELNLPCSPGDTLDNYASPRSRHPGGVNAVFCDSSVHFIVDGIDTTVWRGLGWIADGQAPGNF